MISSPVLRAISPARRGGHACRLIVVVAAILLSLPAASHPACAAQQDDPGQHPAATSLRDEYIRPAEGIQELFSRDKNYAVLDRPAPGGRFFVVPRTTELSTLERVGRSTLRLAMLELRPRVNRTWALDTYGMTGLGVYDLQEQVLRDVDLPEGALVSDPVFSPAGDRLAFLLHGPDRTEVWIAEAATGAAEALADVAVMATLATDVRRFGSAASEILQWSGRDTVVTLIVPPDRGPAPERGLAAGPIVRRSRPEPAPTRTLPFLLRDATDAELFRYHTTSQIAEIAPDGQPRTMGEPGMFESIRMAPDGEHLLTERIVEPLSPIDSYRAFGRVMEVRDRDGDVLTTVRKIPLDEGFDRGGPGVRHDLPREVLWLPDGSGLAWLQRIEEEDEKESDAANGDDAGPSDDGDERAAATRSREDEPVDRIMILTPPFDTEPTELASSPHEMSDLRFTAGATTATVTESRDGERVLVAVAADDGGRSDLTAPWDPEDPLAAVGEPLTRSDGNGNPHLITSPDGDAIWLQGPGWAEDFRPRPFIDRLPLDGDGAERIFEGSADLYEQPLTPLADDMSRLIVQREAVDTFPDSWLWTPDGGFGDNLTGNADPFPEITAAERIDFTFTRRDGLEIQARISLPLGYEEGDRVPAMFWTYPSEYTSEEEYRKAALRSRNRNEFPHLSYLRWSDIWLTQGYALVYPDVPIVGDPYNDNYIQHLDDSLYAAIRETDRRGWIDPDRIGHGGHSYGAFATGNLLANTPYFRAGIAGDGAYNRTLTPMGFQRERRFLWEGMDTYLEMSPFFRADHIDTPLLMYHGADDDNSGTWPMQSFRMMQALTGLGKDAVLYVYPYESHGPRAIESYLDLWARWLDWFDRYVKNPEPDPEEAVE